MKMLAVGAHLDDVEVACGGTVALAVDHGYEVKMLVLSDSAYERYDGTVLRTREESLDEGPRAAGALGVNDLEILDFPTKDIPYHSSVIEAIESRVDAFRPDVIFTHWPFDTHQAHHSTGLATVSASRYYNSILMYEPMMPAARSHVAFRPQVYVDITSSIDRKIDALRCHESQYRKYGDSWIEAVRSRSRLRGFEMGAEYAEAVEALRFEWKP